MPEVTGTDKMDRPAGRKDGVPVLPENRYNGIPGTGEGGEIQGIVEFGLGSNHYAMDISIAREIMEMMPITPIPHAPPYLKGVMNLRGEITHIIDLRKILGLDSGEEGLPAKIIVLTPETAGGESIGIVVDEVMGVSDVGNEAVRDLQESARPRDGGIIKGVIRPGTSQEDQTRGQRHLIIWLDIQSLIRDLIRKAGR